MAAIYVFLLLSLFLVSSCADAIENVEPEELDMLLESGQYEEFAKLMNIDDVSLVIPQEGDRNEDPMMNENLEFGDILLSEEQQEQARQGIRFDRYPGSKWQNRRVPYAIAGGYTSSQRTIIDNAINRWNQQIGCIKLVPRNGNDGDYVYVFSGRGCYSALGRRGGQQPLSLQSNGCVSQGTVIHEFEHAIGFAHEHNRHDRDNFVQVLWNNIPPRWRSQYRKTSSNDYGLQSTYDYYSLMHYPFNAPGTRRPAFRIKQNGIDTSKMGRGNDFTATDIQKIQILYC